MVINGEQNGYLFSIFSLIVIIIFIGGYPTILYTIFKETTNDRYTKILIPTIAIILSILSPL